MTLLQKWWMEPQQSMTGIPPSSPVGKEIALFFPFFFFFM
jgi:hypothetical protein